MKIFTYSHLNNIFEMVKNGEEIIVSKSKGGDKLAVILPYNKRAPQDERSLGVLKGKTTVKFNDGFKLTEQHFLDS